MPTPGPWLTGGEGTVIRDRGHSRQIARCIKWDDYSDAANCSLILAAVNACFAINPSNPQAVAEALPELVSALTEALAGFNLLGKGQTDFANKCRAAIAKLEAK